ncbi:MAG: NAD(P)-binding protein [Thiogranum sp.]|nr:NAD(P)-binding protein [Thiogranum sp.]
MTGISDSRSPRKKLLIVGSGPAGLSIGRLCAEAGCDVRIVEQRDHIAGNCYDEPDEHGVLVHRYGPHYFRTWSKDLLDWLSRFTEWIPGRYYVRACVNGELVPMPVSLSTMTALKGRAFSESEFREYLAQQREVFESPQNAEEQCLAHVGRELYELLFRNYTTKQWGISPRELAASVTARIPLRFDWDERYLNEEYQVMPKRGYTALYSNMADHPNLRIETKVALDEAQIRAERKHVDAIVYTGPLDAMFGCRFGALGYRSLRFEYEHHAGMQFVQPCVQINYPNEHAYTRTVEIKHVTQQQIPGTTLCFEYPEEEGDPFYPLLINEHRERRERYKALADAEREQDCPIYFVGRLAEYKYYNMDQVLLRAIDVAHEILQGWR